MSARPTLSRTLLIPALLGAAAAPSCAPAPQRAPTAVAGCRTVVDGAERRAADSVRWHIAADSPQVAMLDDWCRAVGPAVVVQSRAPTGRIDSLAIISWNLHVGHADLAGFVHDLRDGRLTGGKPVSDFVILAQEARRSGKLSVVAAARQQGLGVYYAPSMRNGRARPGADDRGNAILSTLPLSDLEAVELPLERQRRVVILATVRLGAAGPPMRLADVHLENRSGWLLPNQRATGIGRRDQMRALLRTVRLDGPTVLAGDLNTWAYGTAEPVVGDLVGSQRFTFTPLPEGEPTLVAFFGLYARQLDYVFFRLPDGWSGDSRRVASRYGSDHYPLLAWVRPAGMTVAATRAQ
jgi:endonuclease/exonuclease/phosphatase family metal-dependent hydrolase